MPNRRRVDQAAMQARHAAQARETLLTDLILIVLTIGTATLLVHKLGWI